MLKKYDTQSKAIISGATGIFLRRGGEAKFYFEALGRWGEQIF